MQNEEINVSPSNHSKIGEKIEEDIPREEEIDSL